MPHSSNRPRSTWGKPPEQHLLIQMVTIVIQFEHSFLFIIHRKLTLER